MVYDDSKSNEHVFAVICGLCECVTVWAIDFTINVIEVRYCKSFIVYSVCFSDWCGAHCKSNADKYGRKSLPKMTRLIYKMYFSNLHAKKSVLFLLNKYTKIEKSTCASHLKILRVVFEIYAL